MFRTETLSAKLEYDPVDILNDVQQKFKFPLFTVICDPMTVNSILSF